MKTTTITIALAITCLLSCGHSKPDINALADSFSEIECRAVQLRELRFGLANKIRFTEDTLAHTAGADKIRLEHALATMRDQKTQITARSLALADTIRGKLENVMTRNNLTAAEKSEFNKRLSTLVERKSCLTGAMTTNAL